MFCKSCGRSLYSKRSDLCIPCSAAHTLSEEFKGHWGDSKLRLLAGDIAVSAARHVRGLRIASAPSEAGATPKSAAAKPREEARRSPPRRSPLGRRGKRPEGGATSDPPARTKVSPQVRRKSPAKQPEEVKEEKRAEVPFSPSSYTSTAEEERQRGAASQSSAPGTRSPRREAKARPERERTPRRTSSADRRDRPVIRTDLPANPENDPDHPAWKEKIKRQYFEDLERAKKPKVSLAEGPGGDAKNLLPEALLKVQGESEEREKKPKKQRRKREWTWVIWKENFSIPASTRSAILRYGRSWPQGGVRFWCVRSLSLLWGKQE